MKFAEKYYEETTPERKEEVLREYYAPLKIYINDFGDGYLIRKNEIDG